MYPKQTVVSHHLRQRGSWQVDALIIVCVVAFIVIVLPAFISPYHNTNILRKSYCQHHLKELAMTLQAYCSDYDSYLPSSALVNHSKVWNPNDFKKFTTVAGTLPPKGRPQTCIQVLYNHMKSKDIMYCPGDGSDHNIASPISSYWWKCAIDKAWYGEKGRKPCRTEKDFIYNSDEIVFYEHSSFHCGNESSLRNGDQINVVYLDTHVKNITIKNGSSRTIQDPTAPGEPMYFNYDFNSKKPVVDSKGRAIGQTPATQGDRL